MDLPVIRPQDVHALSPWLLSKAARFVVGRPAEQGQGVIIISQHKTEESAEDARKRTVWSGEIKGGKPRVYRVERP